MADSFIQLPSDSTGKKVDTRTEGTNSEHREVHIIGDPATNEGVAVVTNVDPSGEVYGVVVRDPNTTSIASSVAASSTSLAILDDWDESDRAKVNPIVGQAGVAANQGETDVRTLRVVQAGDSISSVSVTNTTIAVTQSGTWDEVGINDSGNSITIDGTVSLSGALTSAVVVGPTVADTADDGSAPVQVGGIARTANPTAVAANDVVKFTSDDLGRQLTRPIQVRDLVKTAYVSITNGTETTLRAAVAGAYLDCVSLIASNNSSAAVSLDIRAVTAGNIIHTLRIPADSTAGWVPQVPWPQDETGNNWTVDGPDETGRTITVSALFSQEI